VIPGLKTLDTRSHILDDSGTLISEYDRHGKTSPATVIRVKTAVAHTTSCHPHHHLSFLRRSEIDILDFHSSTWFDQNSCVHRDLSLIGLGTVGPSV
jgi:hypothetical protein